MTADVEPRAGETLALAQCPGDHRVDADLPLQPHEHEVADVFEAPLAFLLDPANHRRMSADFQGARRHYYEINWEGRRIWGATAAMLVNLAPLLVAVASGLLLGEGISVRLLAGMLVAFSGIVLITVGLLTRRSDVAVLAVPLLLTLTFTWAHRPTTVGTVSLRSTDRMDQPGRITALAELAPGRETESVLLRASAPGHRSAYALLAAPADRTVAVSLAFGWIMS